MSSSLEMFLCLIMRSCGKRRGKYYQKFKECIRTSYIAGKYLESFHSLSSLSLLYCQWMLPSFYFGQNIYPRHTQSKDFMQWK